MTWFADSTEARSLGIPPTDWLVVDLLPRGALVVVTAPAKHGKTTLVVQLCDALARGAPFLGLVVPHVQRSLILQADMTDDDWRRAWFSEYSALHPSPVMCETVTPHYLGDAPHQRTERERVQQVIHKAAPDVIVLDALESSIPYVWRTNELEGMGRTVEAIRRLVADRTVIILHHPRKAGPDGDSDVDAMAGHHSLGARVTAYWTMGKGTLPRHMTLRCKGRGVGWRDDIKLRLTPFPTDTGTSHLWVPV